MRSTEPPDDGAPRSALSCPDDQYRGLMERYQGGDAQAFEVLYGRLSQDLRAYLDALVPAGHDGALLDEVFLTIHRARRSYDPRRPFEPWVISIARHVALAHRPHRHQSGWALRRRWES